MIKKFLLLALIISLACSCSNYKKISLNNVNIGDISYKGNSINANFNISVNNPTKSTFKVTNIKGVLKKGEGNFINFNVPKDVVIPPGAPFNTSFETLVKVPSPLALLDLGMNAKDYKLDIEATLKQGCFKKKIRYKDIPFEKLEKAIKTLL
jgi:hypothetical protein